MDTLSTSKPRRTPSIFAKKVLNTFFVLCFLGIGGYYAFSSPLNANPTLIHVGTKSTLSSVAQDLEVRTVVRHAKVLKILVRVFSGDKKIKRGDYLFAPHTNVFSVAFDLAFGRHNVSPIRITIKEGSTDNDIILLLADKLAGFRKDLFQQQIVTMQGKLFPDTYFFFSLADTDEIIKELTVNFNKRIAPFLSEIKASENSENEILTMASLIEKEAKGKNDASIISGILWKRIAIGMLLQVDAYRSTYTIKGLPERPINNPGLVAIQAAVRPVKSPYLYYLHDKKGEIHYAVSYADHLRNIALYLR